MRTRLLLVGLGLILSLPTTAMNWRFLRHAPVSHFTEQDWELMRTAGQEALTDASDGDTVGWRNPDTGAFGTIQPLKTYQVEGTTCRRAEVYNNAGGVSATSRFDFCQKDEGTWGLASPTPSKAPR